MSPYFKLLVFVLFSSSHNGVEGCGPDGGWSPWKDWDEIPCEHGYKTNRRYCNNPEPRNLGKFCNGSAVKTKDCDECANSPCQQKCINIFGSYICDCDAPGYKRDPRDWKKCKRFTCPTSNWPSPKNGKTTCEFRTEVPVGSKCIATCHYGFKIKGERMSTCKTDGNWNPRMSPTCQVMACRRLKSPTNGFVTDICTWKPVHNQICHFRCNPGYILEGPNFNKCVNGRWIAGYSVPVCKDIQKPSFKKTCPLAQNVIAERGKTTARVIWSKVTAEDNDGKPMLTTSPKVISPHEFSEGFHTVTYTATDQSENTNVCYFKVNVQVLRCPQYFPPENGRPVGGACGTIYGSVCRLQCNKGYELKGSKESTCEMDLGRKQVYWTGRDSSCEVVKCPSLRTPDNTVKTGYGCSEPTPSYGTTCFFNCKPGYERAKGSTERMCQENEQWSGNELQCKAVMCPPLPIQSEGLIITSPTCEKPGAELDYATECRFTCKNGYRLNGPRLKTCNQNKNWIPVGNPSCIDVLGPVFSNCPPTIMANADRGKMSASVTWTPPTATDNSGDDPAIVLPVKRPGEIFSAGEHFIRYRASDKRGNVGECNFKIIVTVLRCFPKLYTPNGGNKHCTDDNMYGSECLFTCNEGYTMVGSSKRVCEKNQARSTFLWTGSDTRCEVVRCPFVPPPLNCFQLGCRDNVFGDKCRFFCNIGYRLISGSMVRTCQANGTWSGEIPDCQAVHCSALQAPDNGRITPDSCLMYPTYGTMCHFTCKKGYRLHGEPIALCLTNGQWSLMTNVSCKDVEKPSFGTTCPNRIMRYADRSKNYTNVTWAPVIATDNSLVAPNVSLTGVRSIFYTGRHLVLYNASDEAGNFKICSFHVTVEVLRCQRLIPPLKGFLVGHCDNTYGTTCRIQCNDGYDLTGADNITCEVEPGRITGYWNWGQRAQAVCKVRNCSSLVAPQYGFIYPHICASLPVSGTVCFFDCRHGFKRNGGLDVIECGKDGKWNKDDSLTMKCLDVIPPEFLSCPSDIRASINLNSTATAYWKIPAAQDNSNEDVNVTVSPAGVTPPHTFHKNTVIVYTARDTSGNTKNCSFRVLLEDNEGPVVTYCPPDQNKTVTTMKSTVTWRNPQFRDNSNSDLKVKCSHQSGTTFFWGTWKVHCTAFDSNPNNDPALCQFVLRLKPKECPDLRPPKNGAKACDDWAFGQMCSPFCNDKWDFSQQLPPFTIWVCGAKGKWFPARPWPDCSRVYRPGQVRMAIDLHYYNGNCTTKETQRQIKQNFIRMLNDSIYKQKCQDPAFRDKCSSENVKVTCAWVPSVVSRKKRSSAHGRSQRPKLILQTTVSFDMVVNIGNNKGTDDTKETKIEAGLVGLKIAGNISREIRKAVERRSLSLNITGTVFVPDKRSLNISDPERSCAPGQAYREGFCVSCSPGTYLNKTLGTCEDCPVGSYQEKESQETCMICPPITSTEQSRTDHLSGCLAICKAGTYSPTGLKPCLPCEKGSYQELEGQRLCLKCSPDTTTPEEGSNSSKQCGAPCPPGSFSPTGVAPCSLCNRRSFQPHGESRMCVQCPGTTVTAHLGSKSRYDCQEINNCDTNPCKGNATCTDLIDDFLCTCEPGYTGKHCETNIDDCSDTPCSNGGTCHDLVNNYYCSCAQGYQGPSCEDDFDECTSLPCLNNALCTNIPGGYNCHCRQGFTGEMCETDIDECLISPCQNGGTCREEKNEYKCLCPTGYHGKNCEENIDDCASDPCQNDGTCVDSTGTYDCICPNGFYGKNCQKDIDQCKNVECENNATCIGKDNGFDCICQEGFVGKKCQFNVEECDSSPCLNGARCIDGINAYRCDCKDGFDGLHCENNIDDCLSNPCSNNGSCHDRVNDFTCTCTPGFTGKTCSQDSDYCASLPCFNNASCIESSVSFTCQCPDGFNGEQCQYNIDDCQNATCLNGGSCLDGIDEIACVCPQGFTGFRCEIDIDECEQNPCLNKGICADLLNGFHCTCKSGYTGRTCGVDINECLSYPCQNNGTCMDEVNDYSCICADGFSGLHCKMNIDDCLEHACANGATCVDGINSYTCDCPQGFWGKYCETEVNECESFPCLYDGTCYDKIKAFYCACKPGFTGRRCEKNIDDCESRPCVNKGICTDLVEDYSCSCLDGFTGRQCEKRIDYCKGANCSQNSICINLQTGYECNCNDGYFGKYCEFEVDECLIRPCFNDATCNDAVNTFTCSCTEGFTGRYCEQNIDDCMNNSCLNNATCIDSISGYSCLCADGYSGTYCETDINECESAPCRNNGTCVEEIAGYNCRCLDQFVGENCEDKKDFCLSFPCENGGTCQADHDNSTGNITCLCKAGYTGKRCEVNVDKCASEPCMPNSYCTDLVNGYNCKCLPSYTGDQCDIFLGSNFDLIFKRLTEKDMVILSEGEDIPRMDSFTITMFLRVEPKFNSGTLLTYRVPGEPEEVIVLSFSEFHVQCTIKDQVIRANFPLADGLWHFLGVVWNGITGYVSVYIDGPEVKMASNVLKGDTLAGKGWIVLGQRYLAVKKNSALSTAFVGTLHQVNLWNVAANQDHMWNAAHICTFPIAGGIRAWTDFLHGIKGKVEKRFMTQCKASPMCTTNCSHFLDCESRHGHYYCNCQPGFSGLYCNMNIDECSSSPCVNGKCVDGVNRYGCICNKGYWGKNCEKKIKRESEGECPDLPAPLNGRKSCERFSGKQVCNLTCTNGYSYDTETLTAYDCGPDTNWKWNNMERVNVPACSSKTIPKEIEHHFKISMRDMSPCEGSQRYDQFRSAFEQQVGETLGTIHGCLNPSSCKMKEVTVPGCGWTTNERKRRAVADAKVVLFSLSVKPFDSVSTKEAVEEKNEAILFQIKYAVSTGQFVIVLDGINSTANRSSFEHVSSDVICNPGHVKGSERMGCVACSEGTFYNEQVVTCTPCPQGSYQDEEGRRTCKLCGKGKTTLELGSKSKEECVVNKGI